MVGINDNPIITSPEGVLQYQKGIICRSDYQAYYLLKGTYCGQLIGTAFDRNATTFPPIGPTISAAESRVRPPPPPSTYPSHPKFLSSRRSGPFTRISTPNPLPSTHLLRPYSYFMSSLTCSLLRCGSG